MLPKVFIASAPTDAAATYESHELVFAAAQNLDLLGCLQLAKSTSGSAHKAPTLGTCIFLVVSLTRCIKCGRLHQKHWTHRDGPPLYPFLLSIRRQNAASFAPGLENGFALFLPRSTSCHAICTCLGTSSNLNMRSPVSIFNSINRSRREILLSSAHPSSALVQHVLLGPGLQRACPFTMTCPTHLVAVHPYFSRSQAHARRDKG